MVLEHLATNPAFLEASATAGDRAPSSDSAEVGDGPTTRFDLLSPGADMRDADIAT